MFLQVGFKSLSYEIQEQQPAYDSNALFGNEWFFLHLCLFLIQNCNIFDRIEQRSGCECGPQRFIVYTFKKRQLRNL